MLSNNTVSKFKLTNPYIFWGLISIFFFLTFFLNQYFIPASALETNKVQPSIVEQSYTEKKIVVDPDNLDRMDFEKKSSTAEATKSNLDNRFSENRLLLLLLLYTIILSFLFMYREKQNKKKLAYMKKQEDALRIAVIQAEEKGKIYENMWDDMEKFKYLLEPELKICSLKDQLEKNIDCCMADGIIVSTRKVLEKTLLPLQYETFPNFKGETTLNGMIYHLGEKDVLTRTMKKDAKAIQSLGNTAAHADTDATIAFEARDAISSINYLLRFIKELDTANLLKN